jgi:hypothetical protein
MKGHYLGLAIAVVVLAATLTLLGRPRRAEPPATAAAPTPVAVLELAIEGGRVAPAMASVPKDARVRLHVDVRAGRGARDVRLSLAGYEDRLAIPELAPGSSWTGEFFADRPGEDFAWLIDGVPAGRLAVTGSHLIEGHR